MHAVLYIVELIRERFAMVEVLEICIVNTTVFIVLLKLKNYTSQTRGGSPSINNV